VNQAEDEAVVAAQDLLKKRPAHTFSATRPTRAGIGQPDGWSIMRQRIGGADAAPAPVPVGRQSGRSACSRKSR
jgi:hypothetical protein